jgi:hypothetical protein
MCSTVGCVGAASASDSLTCSNGQTLGKQSQDSSESTSAISLSWDPIQLKS